MPSDLEFLCVGTEDLLVAVGGAIQHHDHVALSNPLPADLDVARRRPRHVRHRAGPAQHLLDRTRDQRGVRNQPAAFVRMLDERQRAKRDEVPCGFVTRHKQQECEVQQVFVGQLVPVDLGGGQAPTACRFAARRDGRRSAAGSTRTARRWPRKSPVSISGSALPVHASDHLRNCSQSSGGAPSSSAIIRVGSGAASSSANSWVDPDRDVVEDSVDDLADLRLEDRHLPPGEPGVDQLAQLTVPRRVGEDEVALLNRVRHHGVGDGDALGRGELVRIASRRTGCPRISAAPRTW